MKRTFIFALALAALSISSLGLALPVFATVSPTLALSATGSGDNVQINITGDPNVSVLLSYVEAGSGSQIISLGNTDANGSFSTVVSSASYGLTSGTLVAAILNGTSGPKSPTIAWPTVAASASTFTLSPNAVVVNAGSSTGLTASGFGSTALYVSNNSNPSIANVNISGTQITISGNTAGSTIVTLCQVGNTTNCPSVYVTVESAGAGQLSFSQNNASVVEGQNLPITITGGSGNYAIMNNSSASTIQASISGSVLTLSTGATSGSSSITVCSTDMSMCGVVSATAGSASSVAITFSNSAPVVSMNQNTTINIYGPSGVSFYVSSNSNPSIVQANLSGTTLTLAGIADGSSNISVCASTGTCNSLAVTVNSIATGGNITLSQNTLSILTGQNIGVIVSGGTEPYFVSGGTNSISQETLNGNTLTVYGISLGMSSVNVCSSGGGCVILAITVNGTGVAAIVPPSTIQTTPAASSSTLTQSQVQAIVSLLQSFGADQSVIANTQAALGGQTVSSSAAVPATSTVSSDNYVFSGFVHLTSKGTEVTELQKRLTALGFYSGSVTGYFGSLTQAAVKAFQTANGITQAGYVGPGTRAALNK